MLTHWTRDRRRGPKLPVERVIELQTRLPAEHMGLHDRGVLALGRKADINVINLARLSLGRPALVPDLPGGGARLLQPTRGYVASFVAGRRIVDNDRLTGATPGAVLRGAQPRPDGVGA
jgi:N-acyl-D-aspartate/D-glutamate deacylase